ncbi:hypothetical protein LBMAG42_31270 [Deltaproteobacteria bacterium]|nr:hypothetical protein LBMAG42_31270 [Deltaproteobacteria bacterium]
MCGARQVGKSTLLDMTFGAESETVVFDAMQDIEGARRDPDLFLDSRGFQPGGAPRRPRLILDEIQFAPELVPAIKRRVDRLAVPGQFLLSGSQQWQVMKHLAESLAGRAAFVDLEGFTLAELAGKGGRPPWLAAFLLDPEVFVASDRPRLPLPRTVTEQVFRGFMPGVQGWPDAALDSWFAGYVRTYLERDARAFGDVHDWAEFGRFLRLAAAHSGQEVNAAQLGREVGLTPQTVRRWYATLAATFQWSELPPFHTNAVKRQSLRAKGYVTDVGLAAYLLGLPSANALLGRREWGALFETAVVGELRRQLAIVAPGATLSHYRAHGGAEVDVVIDHGGRLHPIEVKGNSRPHRQDAAGILAFRAAHSGRDIAPGVILAPAERAYAVAPEVWVVPWDVA